jgi:hypothetical protein
MAPSGTLTGAEQLRFAWAAVKSQIQSLPGTIRARPGRGEASAVARDVAPPDSALATNALEFVEELYPASLSLLTVLVPRRLLRADRQAQL